MSSGFGGTANSVCLGCEQPRTAARLDRFRTRFMRLLARGSESVPPVYAAMAPEDVLTALPDTSQELREAIAAGCCILYTVAEGHCDPSCGSGWCCYHVVSTGCKMDRYECVNVPCSTGNFTTGC